MYLSWEDPIYSSLNLTSQAVVLPVVDAVWCSDGVIL